MNSIIGALRAVLGMDTVAFEKGIGVAQKQISGLNRTFQSVAKDMDKVGKVMSVAVSAPLLAMRAVTTKTAADFEEGMNKVQAATQATAAEFTALTTKAREIGKTTAFSATEAASAMEALAKNGLTTKQILDGAAQATVDLAAANGAQLAPAADIVTDTMNNFGKTAADLPGVVSNITGALIASKFGFDDYKLAMGQAAGVAGKVGVTFEDFNAALAATSSSFASGSDAGTSFKTFLTKLSPTSIEAKQAMQALKLEFYDSNGAMLSMEKIAGNLQGAFKELSDEARTSSATKIFGTDSMRTALALATAGTAGIRKMREEIAKVSASDQAEVRLRGFNGAMRQLKSAAESLQLAIGDSGLLATATKFVNVLTDLTRRLAALNPEVLKFATIASSVAIAIGPVLVGVSAITSAFGKMMVMLSRAVPLLAGVMVAVGPWAALAAAITVAVGAVVLFSDQIPISTDGAYMLSDALAGLGAEAARMAAQIEPAMQSLREIGIDLPAIAAKIGGVWSTVAGVVVDALAGVARYVISIVDSLGGLFMALKNVVVATFNFEGPLLSVEEFAKDVQRAVAKWVNEAIAVMNWLREKIGKDPLPLLPIPDFVSKNAKAMEEAGAKIADAWRKGFDSRLIGDAMDRVSRDANTAAINRQIGAPGPDFPISNKPAPVAPPPGGGRGGAGLAGGGGGGQESALKKLKEFMAENARAIELERMSAEQRQISEALYKAEALAKEAGVKLTKDDTDAITANVLALRAAKTATDEKERMDALAKTTIEEATSAQEKYNKLIADLTTLYSAGAISQDQYLKAQELARENMRGGKGEWSTQWAEFADAVSGAAKSVAMDLLDTDKTLGEMLASMAKRIAQFALEILVLQPIFDAIGKMIKGSLSGGSGGGIGDLIGMAISALGMFAGGSSAGTGAGGSTNASYGGGMSYGGPRAEGGSVSPGQWYKINERGEEGFVPQVPGQIISHRDMMDIGKTGDFYQTNNIHPDVRQTARAQVMDMLPMIKDAAAGHVKGLRQRGGPMKAAFSR